MKRLKPYDKRGRPIEVGDWVRLVEMPPDVPRTMPKETINIFERAIGLTFRVDGFGRYGHAELNLSKKVEKDHFIWVEPCHIQITRRKKIKKA